MFSSSRNNNEVWEIFRHEIETGSDRRLRDVQDVAIVTDGVGLKRRQPEAILDVDDTLDTGPVIRPGQLFRIGLCRNVMVYRLCPCVGIWTVLGFDLEPVLGGCEAFRHPLNSSDPAASKFLVGLHVREYAVVGYSAYQSGRSTTVFVRGKEAYEPESVLLAKGILSCSGDPGGSFEPLPTPEPLREAVKRAFERAGY